MTNAQSLGDKSLNGILWTGFSQGGEAALQAIILIVLARLLVPEDFGVFGAALVVVNFSQMFAQLGLGPALVQRAQLEAHHVRAGFFASTLMGCALAFLVIGAAPVVARLFRMPELVPVLRVTSLLFVISGLSIVAQSLLQRELRFRELALTSLGSFAIGYGLVGIALAALGTGVWALVLANLTQRTLRTGSLLYLSRHPIGFRWEGRAFRELIGFGGGQTLAQLGNFFAREGDNVIVGRWLGSDALGLYGRAYQLMVTPTNLLAQGLNVVLFASLAQIQDAPDKLALVYRRGVVAINSIMLPASVVLAVLAPEIVGVLLGNEWHGAIVPFQLLALGLAFRTTTILSESLARAAGAVYRSAWRQWVYAGAVIAGALVGKQWGLPGVALGVLLAILLKFVLLTQLGLRLTNISLGDFTRAHGTAVLLSLIAWFEVEALVGLLRGQGLPGVIVLLICATVLILSSVALLGLFRRVGIAADLLWVIARVAKQPDRRGRDKM